MEEIQDNIVIGLTGSFGFYTIKLTLPSFLVVILKFIDDGINYPKIY
ncbi:MAG: hypothetical protein ACOC5T_00680 [Elusimicrobiota bacterium]